MTTTDPSPDALAERMVSAVVTTAADRLFAAAGRVLRPGGELWTVYNSALRHKPTLTRLIGPTHVVDRTPKFTVTVSTAR